MGITYAASGQITAALKKHVVAITSMRERLPVEKLYLQLDKPYYATGDTLRFKAYLLNGDFLTPSIRSGLLYVEMANENNITAKRIMVQVNSGLAWGDIALTEKELPHGNYTLRAYTNWMRNFGEEYVFKKQIYISAISGNEMLVKANFAQKNNKVESVLQFTALDGRPARLKQLELKIMQGNKNLSRDKVTTGLDGSLEVNFELPSSENAKNNFFITAQDITKGTTAAAVSIPIILNRLENTDVQFMPEGGSLVAGIKTKVGFKAIGEDGKGTAIAGSIVDSRQQVIALFKTSHAGMGSFEFTPNAGETYTAKINGINKIYHLPVVNLGGTALSITSTNDSLRITVNRSTATTSAVITAPIYYLIGQSRGVVCYAQAISFDKNGPVAATVATSLFPTGIARFSLINAEHQPVNERQVFINHEDELNLSITTNKLTYTLRDSVALAITVKDKDGKPVKGNFSLAVTDNSQVKTDSLSSNILNNLLLTDDLKGNIEEPGYYFVNVTPQKATDLDNLLLTQGWIAYDWKEIFYPERLQPQFAAEKEFNINGTVSNVFGKPLGKMNVLVFANHPEIIEDVLTDKNGRYNFKGLVQVDTAIFKLQARNRNGKEVNVQLNVDKVKSAVFNPAPTITPWYINSDSIRLNNNRTKAAQIKAIANYNGDGHMLNEVIIKEKRSIIGSKNLNGPGEADQIIDQEELDKAGKMTLHDLLLMKIKGIYLGGFTPPRREYGQSLQIQGYIKKDLMSLSPTEAAIATNAITHGRHKPWRQSYLLGGKEICYVIDGIDLDFFYNDSFEVPTYDTKRFMFMKPYLDYFTAEDITGIELMSSERHTSLYDNEFEPDKARMGRSNAFAYIEITTRSKKGPFMQVTPGTYLYKATPFSLAKQFYSPKYTVKNKTTAVGTDMRSTLFWEPNVITDGDGKATISFFSADKPSAYTVIVEGTDQNGNLGYKRQKIN
ncbi:hypothetical protein [Mucilaginibacter sp.]